MANVKAIKTSNNFDDFFIKILSDLYKDFISRMVCLMDLEIRQYLSHASVHTSFSAPSACWSDYRANPVHSSAWRLLAYRSSVGSGINSTPRYDYSGTYNSHSRRLFCEARLPQYICSRGHCGRRFYT